MLPEQMPSYKLKLLKQIQHETETFVSAPAQDMNSYHSRLGQIMGYKFALSLFEEYMKKGEE